MQYLQIVLDDGWFGGGFIMAIFLAIVIACAYLGIDRHRMNLPTVLVHIRGIRYKVLKKQCSQNSNENRKLD